MLPPLAVVRLPSCTAEGECFAYGRAVSCDEFGCHINSSYLHDEPTVMPPNLDPDNINLMYQLKNMPSWLIWVGIAIIVLLLIM